MKKWVKQGIYLILGMGLSWGCTSDALSDSQKSGSGKSQGPYRFELLEASQTGLNFENVLEQSSEFNVFNYMYFFNGGGVAAADFNQDGKIDLYFTSNMGPNKLFLNKGNMKFEDVSKEAGVEGMGGWTSGVSVVDINHDGMLDLYVSQIGEYQTLRGENQLYVCQSIENGIPHFENEAYRYGLNLKVFGTQSTFFDYDKDGDLDLFQLNHSLHRNGTFGQRKVFQKEKHSESGDKLLRNDNGRFVEVSTEAGINSTVIGYGLGVVTGDVNQDGWPDIYVGNDFHENDYLYLNQQDGTFKEVLTEQMRHTSRFSMGVDMGDINNDAQTDIISLDMLPYNPEILKASLGEDAYGIFTFKLGYGYNHQFSRNNLQLNNGNQSFTEIGMFADVYATDWSWAPLFMDFDQDGYKDLFISNGIPRRMNDIDYVNFRANHELKWKQNTNNLENEDLSLVNKMPQIKLKNKFFLNQKDLSFQDMDSFIKNDRKSYSNGAIYADLDQDGDLDIVVNNLGDAPFIYKNNSREIEGRDYVHVDLTGPEKNPLAIGARLLAFKGEEVLSQEHYLVRGYQSSMAPGLHLGLGKGQDIDSVVLVWPDDGYEVIPPEKFNQSLKISHREGLATFDYRVLKKEQPRNIAFKEVSSEFGLDVRHEENPFVEFNRETLIPHMVSREGPALAVGDANGDGREDLFMGSSKRRRSKLLLQQANGRFVDRTPQVIKEDSLWEDVDACWVDIENDGDLDLVVATGGNEYWGSHEALRQRVYLNDGKGNFTSNKDIFGETYLTASCVRPADFNGDGWVDLFFGARAVPWKYGRSPRSYLFINKGDGSFREATEEIAPDLSQIGLVTDAKWEDMDGDGDADLLLALEWGSLHLFTNEGGKLNGRALNDWKGWWNMVEIADFDGDGDMDIVAGNTGKNSKLKPSPQKPVRLYLSDYDDNDKVDQILTYYLGGKEIPFHNYKELTQQLPGLKKKFLLAKDFASASLEELLGEEKVKAAEVLEANHFESVYLEQVGQGEFVIHMLPDELQFSTLHAAELCDLDSDGVPEVLLGGNFYECNIEMGRYDGNFGNLLRIGQGGKFELMPLGEIQMKGQVRKIEILKIDGRESFIFVKNDDFLQVLQADGRPL